MTVADMIQRKMAGMISLKPEVQIDRKAGEHGGLNRLRVHAGDSHL